MPLLGSFAPCARHSLLLFTACAVALPTAAQDRHATTVVSYNPGPNAHPSYVNPTLFLGGPQGGGFSTGSLDVVALGVDGELTVGFDVTIVDGPGADFTVSENGFVFGGGVFAEVAFVEVSTDGTTFARFPTRYGGPVGPLPAFGSSPMGTFGGLCGGLPGIANVNTNAIDPFDPVESGGEAFDLAELAGDPLVTAGVVDLGAIHYVRVLDVPEGLYKDSFGNVIWDHGGPIGSADVDAVSVINHAGNVTAHQPIADFRVDPSGYVELRLADPDGIADLDLSTLRASIDLQPSSFGAIRPLFRLVQRTPQGVLLRSVTPLVGSGVFQVLGISIRDHSGQFSGDQVILPG
jgi:hypothetical protein